MSGMSKRSEKIISESEEKTLYFATKEHHFILKLVKHGLEAVKVQGEFLETIMKCLLMHKPTIQEFKLMEKAGKAYEGMKDLVYELKADMKAAFEQVPMSGEKRAEY